MCNFEQSYDDVQVVPSPYENEVAVCWNLDLQVKSDQLIGPAQVLYTLSRGAGLSLNHPFLVVVAQQKARRLRKWERSPDLVMSVIAP
jgi:hypothetical protein